MCIISAFSHISVFLIALFLVPEKADSHSRGGQYAGEWTYYAHGNRGGSAYILDSRRILINNFFYDGRGPEAWFQVKYGKTSNPPQPCGNHRSNLIIPDDEGMNKPGRYLGEDIILTIPPDRGWADVDWIALFCYKFQHLFGFVKIPALESLPKDVSLSNSSNPGICPEQIARIKKDGASPVTCSIDQPSKTSGGTFP